MTAKWTNQRVFWLNVDKRKPPVLEAPQKAEKSELEASLALARSPLRIRLAFSLDVFKLRGRKIPDESFKVKSLAV